MKKILRFLFYPYPKKKLLGQSLFFLWVVRISLWLFSFKVLDRWLSSFGSPGGYEQQTDPEVVDRVVKSVQACSRYVPYASCLTQALTARTLLQMRGQSCQLKIGVKKDEDEKFAAHAWIEVDGRIVIGKRPYHRDFSVLGRVNSAVL